MIAQIIDALVREKNRWARCCTRCSSVDLEEIVCDSQEFLTKEEIAKEWREWGDSPPLREWRCGMCGGQFPETNAKNILSGEIVRWNDAPAVVKASI